MKMLPVDTTQSRLMNRTFFQGDVKWFEIFSEGTFLFLLNLQPSREETMPL